MVEFRRVKHNTGVDMLLKACIIVFIVSPLSAYGNVLKEDSLKRVKRIPLNEFPNVGDGNVPAGQGDGAGREHGEVIYQPHKFNADDRPAQRAVVEHYQKQNKGLLMKPEVPLNGVQSNQPDAIKLNKPELVHNQGFAKANPAVPNSLNRAQPNQPGTATSPRKPVKIADSEECSADVKALCSDHVRTNNFDVLDCLQNDLKADQAVSTICQNFLWSYKHNLTKDIRFDGAASEVCKDDLKRLSECSNLKPGTGQVISCLIENRPNVTNQACQRFLVKMSSIVFSDYHLVNKFAVACEADIDSKNCGRVPNAKNDSPHSQGHTIECLSGKVKELQPECKHEILRIAELQADDYHMDRPLFYACRDDREMLCRDVRAGEGKIYKCLYRHKFDREMSDDCREQLVHRQRLMQEDYKINKGFADACRTDIKKHSCLEAISPSDPERLQMSTVLICLESALKDNGAGSITSECFSEMNEMRKSLLSDYQISPNLIVACHEDIIEFCEGQEEGQGKTLHCLMDAARPDLHDEGKSRLSKLCMRELEGLLLEADVGENVDLDPVLHEACSSVAQHLCRGKLNRDGEVMDCLMEHLGTNDMTDECEAKLIEVQYFIARDFKMDPRLYKYCSKDAAQQCHADSKWFNKDITKPSQGPLIFSCLYRHLKYFSEDPQRQLSRGCQYEVRRVMRQRAASVELEPEVEQFCLHDLSAFCSANLDTGEEMHCLQDNLGKLSAQCRSVVGNITQDEDMDPNLDRILMKACTPMISMFCKELLKNDKAEAGDIMECLIDNKNDPEMDIKCHSGIEHHQLITLKDYRFSYKFKEACKRDVMEHCKEARKKSEVVTCLSKAVRDDKLTEKPMRISDMCYKHLRRQLTQRSENIQLDPDLNEKCRDDVDKYCSNVTPGRAAIVECLEKHQKELENTCHNLIFKREEEEAEDPNTDYLLFTSCKRMIKRYCGTKSTDEVFRCLRHHKEEEDFDDKCRRVVILRQRLRSKDVRLNPNLEKACRLDMTKFCPGVAELNTKLQEMEGKFLECLRIKFSQKRLTSQCTAYMSEMIQESALDYQQDPALALSCKLEIEEFCQAQVMTNENGDQGEVHECLKTKLLEKKIKNTHCIAQIARVLAEDKADVHVDPLLYKACALDLSHYCKDIPRGQGRQMSCLLAALDDRDVRLQTQCRNMLQSRVDMWEYAAKVAPPDTFQEVIEQLSSSSSRNYFMIIFMSAVAIIFCGGLCCGRVTKRVSYATKTK